MGISQPDESLDGCTLQQAILLFNEQPLNSISIQT